MKKVFEKPDNCPICLDFIGNKDEKPLENCGHWFHKKCLTKSRQKLCPLCRFPLEIPLEIPLENVKNINLTLEVYFEDTLTDDEDFVFYKGDAYDTYLFLKSIKDLENLHEFYEYDLEFMKNLSQNRHLTKDDKKACKDAMKRYT